MPKTEEQLALWTNRFKTLGREFSKRDTKFADLDDLYWGRHWLREPDPDDIEERVTINPHRQTVDITTSLFAADDMHIQVIPPLESKMTLGLSDKLEKFFRGAIYENDLRRGRSVRGDEVFNMAELGWGVIRMTFVEDGRFPIRLQPIHPRNIYAKRDTDGFSWVVFHARRTRADIESEWDAYPPAKRAMRKDWNDIKWEDKQNQNIEYMDVWFKQGQKIKNIIIADKTLIKPETDETERYPNIPYYIMLANPTNSPLPEEWSTGSIDSLMENPHHAERLLTKLNRIVTMYAALPIIARTRSPIEITADVGQVVTLSPDSNESVDFMKYPGTAPDLNGLLQYFMQQISMDSYPLAIYGNAPSMSGYALQQLGEGGRLRLWPMRRSLETGWSMLLQDMLRLVLYNQPNEPIEATGVKGGKPFTAQIIAQQFEGFKVHVTFPIKSPVDEMRKAQMAVQLQPLLPIRTLQEDYLDRQSPEDELDRMMAEKALMHPMIIQMAMQEIMQKWYPDLVAKMRMMQQQQPAQGPPPENIPAIPGTPGMSQPGRPPLPQEVGAPAGAPMSEMQGPEQPTEPGGPPF